MIRTLRLVNWRAYDDLELKLEPGTTYIAARNGIGKTSLIEGAGWALYGDAAGRPPDVVRKGSKVATATVELEFPDRRILTITREMPAKLAKSASARVVALLDDVAITAEDAEALIVESLAGELTFLARLTMLRSLSSGLADPTLLNLNYNLSRVFGVDGLQHSLVALDARRKVLNREIALAREAAPRSPAELARLRSEVADRDAAVSRLTTSHNQAIGVERDAESELCKVDAYDAWSVAQTARDRQLTDLAREAGVEADILKVLSSAHAAGKTDLAAALMSLWETAQLEATASLEELRVRTGILQARIEALQLALAELATAEGSCPVCRRPLAPEDEQAARVEHELELTQLEHQLSGIDATTPRRALDQIRVWIRRLSPLMHRSQSPEQPTVDRETALANVESARAARSDAVELLVAARAAGDSARDALVQASADEADKERLVQLYAQEATVAAATTAVKSAVDGLMKQTVGPLADELANRWKLLFADRGTVRLESGAISREVNGLDLPFGAFSEGEQASSQLLLRLLVLDAATRADFCWIDEPLEHLDPVTRRHIGNMLARATTHSAARQVVVTTYEEPLARRLALRYPEHARVVYVRPGDTASG